MHGTLDGGPPRRGPGAGGGSTLRLIARILFREAAVGCPLYFAMGDDRRLNFALGALVFAGLLVVTRRHGLLQRRSGIDAVTECVVVFFGALAFRNVLVILSVLLSRP